MKRIGALLAAVGLLLGACGGSSGPDPEANPKEALISAFENLANSEGMEIVLSLDATSEDLRGLAGEGDQAVDEETAQKILDSSLRVLTKGKGEEASFEMVATIAGEEDLEIKVVDQVAYFRADVESLTETFGGDPAELEAMGQQAKAQGLTFVEPALNGEWIAITGAEQLSQQFGGATDPDQMTENQEKLVRDITQAIEESATVTNEGSDDAGEHLSVSLPVREIYQRMMSSFQSLPGFPGGQLPPETEIPDETVVMDVWIDDDRVTQAAIDFVQFASLAEGGGAADGRVALLMELDEFDDEIETPDDAVEVPAEQLMQMFMGGMGGMGAGGQSSGGTPPDFDCDQLKGAPPAIKEQFADMCPDL